MIKITKPLLQKALIAGFFSTITIGVLTILTYKSTLGYFIAASFGSSMVLLFGFPESPFAQPKNVFFGHLLTALVGVIFVNFIPLPVYMSIAFAVGIGVFLMIEFKKEIFKKALIAGLFSAFTIGVLTVLTYKSALGLFLAASFGSA